MKYQLKDDYYEPIELIVCPFCASRLNRIEGLLPTSCRECEKHNFKPKILFVKEVIESI
jgi:hypothetical protein